jgi:hypothetical protein
MGPRAGSDDPAGRVGWACESRLMGVTCPGRIVTIFSACLCLLPVS